MKTWAAVLAALFFCLSGVANAQNIIGSGIIGDVKVASASPTWTGTTSGVNAACGFVTTCTITGVTVPAGFIIVGVGGPQGAVVASSVSALTVCGTSLTLVSSPSVANNGTVVGEFQGSTAGGTCSIVATAGTGGWNTMVAALGLLSNLSSTTAGTGCVGYYAGTQNAPYPCSSSVTVSTGGFGISVIGSNSGSAMTSSNMTIDAQNTSANISLGIAHFTTTETPTFSGGNFAQANIVASPWR